MTLLNFRKLKPIPTWEPIDWEELAEVTDFSATPKIETTIYKPSKFDPSNLEEFIGQAQNKKILDIIIKAALKNNEFIPNLLLTGTYGHGKTTLSQLIALESGKEFRLIDGSTAETFLKNPNSNLVYIVDEIHNIPPVLADSLNILIDQNKIHLIGCTTSPGKLQAPFKSRFRHIYLSDYNLKDMSLIVKNAFKRVKTNISLNAVEEIAKRSKLNPRTALSILKFVKEVQITENIKIISKNKTLEILNILGINELGLTEMDLKYLEALRYDKPIGLKSLASILSLDEQTIEEQIEPYLLKERMIERTARGRIKVVRNEFFF